MSNIKFDYPIKRIVVIPMPGNKQPLAVGEVEEFIKEDTVVHVNIRLADDLPAQIQEAIEKNPKCIRIVESLAAPINVMIIPTRPKIIT